jgi:hypothetical protein
MNPDEKIENIEKAVDKFVADVSTAIDKEIDTFKENLLAYLFDEKYRTLMEYIEEVKMVGGKHYYSLETEVMDTYEADIYGVIVSSLSKDKMCSILNDFGLNSKGSDYNAANFLSYVQKFDKDAHFLETESLFF